MNKENEYILGVNVLDKIEEENKVLFDNKLDDNINDFHQTNLLNIFNNTNKEHILCVGQVQSGKTKNIENVIKYAIENEYKFVIFFAGITNLLLEQTKNRIENSINKINEANNNLFNFYDHNNIENLVNISKHYQTNIITILKGSNSLNKVFNALDIIDLRFEKVLIIDDECDYASINIGQNQTSRIYQIITSLYNRIHDGKLISFTGTPFANIINRNSEELKIDRIVTLLNYKDYCGLEYFNNLNNYIVVDSSKHETSVNIKTKKHSILYSLLTWLVYTAIALNDDSDYKSELLINIDTENADQTENYQIVLNESIKIYKSLKINDYRVVSGLFIPFIKDKLKLNIEFEIIKNQVVNVLDYLFENETNRKIILLNSTNENSNKFKSGKYKYSIIVSGFMASRGFTFENLTTQLFLNVPSNKIAIDTLLQRCRWFGNRKTRSQYLKIITNQRIVDALKLASKYLEVFVPGTSTINILDIKAKIYNLDKNNVEVESTNQSKRR